MSKKTAKKSLSPKSGKKASAKYGRRRHTNRKKTSLGMFLFKWCFILAIWASLFSAGVIAWYARDLPDITDSATFERRTSIIVKAADGSTIARYGEQKGDSVRVEDLPPHLIQAVLAIEDRRFYAHPGIDLIGIARAMAINLAKGKLSQGGSTITQQLAKNLFLTHDRKLQRKIKEAILALWLENQLTKNEILTAYLNRVYLGSGVYGVNAASELYFNKSAQEINLQEAAILAGLLKAPSLYSPLNNPELARKRGEVVLAAMVDAGYIKKNEAKSIIAQPSRPSQKPTGEKAVRYYTDWVIDGLDNLIGTPDMDLVIETTLDPRIQTRAEESLLASLLQNGADKKVSQGGIIVMRPDGAVLAMIGGRDYTTSQFNRATQAKRAPGSSFKPIVYLTALQQGHSPQEKILDAPITQGDYRPQNFGGKYYGEVTLVEALTNSMNTAAVRLMMETGPSSVINTAQKLGIESKLEPDLSLALGSSGVSMLEMTTAYAILANGGKQIYPYGIIRIKNSEDRTIYERKPPQSYEQILDPRATQQINSMMRNVIENGTGRAARLNIPAAGKTGTSQDSRDAWFLGFTDRLVTSVWLGNDDNSPMNGITGGSLPAHIWQEIMVQGNTYYEPSRLVSSGGSFSAGSFQNLLNSIISNGSAQNAPVNYSRMNN